MVTTSAAYARQGQDAMGANNSLVRDLGLVRNLATKEERKANKPMRVYDGNATCATPGDGIAASPCSPSDGSRGAPACANRSRSLVVLGAEGWGSC